MTANHAYYEGLNQKLLAAIPDNARNVLEIGCATGRLGEAFKRSHPSVRWTGIDVNPTALHKARERLDRTLLMNVDEPNVRELGDNYDVVIFGDVLEHLRNPEDFLNLMHRVSAPDGRMMCCLPNMTHASVIERMLAGDLMYDEAGLLDKTHLRFLSSASSFKLLLDAGWLPNLRDSYDFASASEAYQNGLVQAAVALGIPPRTARANLLRYQLIVDCVKSPPSTDIPGAPFTVVVPVTSKRQFDLNVRRSPGLQEVNAELLPVENAPTAAAAFEFGRQAARTEWIVYCHQDVYFPRGTGRQLAHLFSSIPQSLSPSTLIGFAGLGRGPDDKVHYSGLVIDRLVRFDHPESLYGVSLDELAIAYSRHTSHRLDPRLGWHCWGTDVCLSGMKTGLFSGATITRIPLFHNSTNDGTLTSAFHHSAQILAEKHQQVGVIPTLNGLLQRRSNATTHRQ